MAGQTVRGQVYGRVQGILTPGVSPTFEGRGVASIARTAAGDYTLTFADDCELDPNTTILNVQARTQDIHFEPCKRGFTTTSVRIQTYDATSTLADYTLEIFSIEGNPPNE